MAANRSEALWALKRIIAAERPDKIDQIIPFDYAEASYNDLSYRVLYGHRYSRLVWENLCDAVREFARHDYDSANIFMERAYMHAEVPYNTLLVTQREG